MSKNILAIFFSIVFISLITAPTILVLIDDSIDLSLIYDISEEEEEKGSEKNKELEVFVVELHPELNDFTLSKNKADTEHAFKTYPKPHLNLVSPPPEFIL